MSDSTPPPVPLPIEPTGPVKAARSLWIISFAVGLLAAVFVFLARNAQVERLRQLVTDLQPDRNAETLRAVATFVVWGSLGALVLLIVVEALLLRVMMRRHGGARWALLIVLLIHGAVAVLADAIVVAPTDEGVYVRILLGAQLLLAVAGLVVSMLPGARRWFRAEHKARGRPLA